MLRIKIFCDSEDKSEIKKITELLKQSGYETEFLMGEYKRGIHTKMYSLKKVKTC